MLASTVCQFNATIQYPLSQKTLGSKFLEKLPETFPSGYILINLPGSFLFYKELSELLLFPNSLTSPSRTSFKYSLCPIPPPERIITLPNNFSKGYSLNLYVYPILNYLGNIFLQKYLISNSLIFSSVLRTLWQFISNVRINGSVLLNPYYKIVSKQSSNFKELVVNKSFSPLFISPGAPCTTMGSYNLSPIFSQKMSNSITLAPKSKHLLIASTDAISPF